MRHSGPAKAAQRIVEVVSAQPIVKVPVFMIRDDSVVVQRSYDMESGCGPISAASSRESKVERIGL